MFICGSNFVGGELACSITPTAIDDINYIELKNGVYDDLYVTKDIQSEVNNLIPEDWNFDTILWAKFNNNTSAGNVDWSIETVSHVIVKVREINSFVWRTIYVKDIHTYDDFVINYPDYLIASGQTCEYAIVPVLYGAEGVYSTSTITPKFDKMFLIEDSVVWGTEITDGFCDTTRNIPSSTIVLLNKQRPIFVSNTIANYDTGTCKGAFVPVTEDQCTLAYDSEYDYQRIRYQKDFMDFISDRIPKILKMPDGRIWIVQITPDPTDSAETVYNNRYISFSWVEVGDINSEEELYYLGLSNVTSEWWNN